MSRTPHKCPVCRAGDAMIKCKACKGKGIVWEPEITEAVATVPVDGNLDLTYQPD